MTGVIGGSGLYEINGLEDIERTDVKTPWGEPSGAVTTGVLNGARMAFLPRHGIGHTLLPSEINYRANIYALKSLGVERIVSVSAVGSMREEIKPGKIIVPSQFIDLTKNRESSFFGGGIVAHVSMAEPVCPRLSSALYQSALKIEATAQSGGTYVCMEGPQFSSRAESMLYRNWKVDVIGMTNMPEAKLAREAEICYATLAMATDYDCWHDEHEAVTVDSVIKTLAANVETAKKIINKLPELLGEERDCRCSSALENAVLTSPEMISEETKKKLGIIMGRFFK